MRHTRSLAPIAAALLLPALARAEGPRPGPVVDTGALHPGAPPAAAHAGAAPAPGPRSRAVSIPIEIVSPVGGAGCFYQRRPLTGALVVAGSLIAGGALVWAAAHGDRDAAILDAVAYGLVRGAGIFAAALPAALPTDAATVAMGESSTPSPRAIADALAPPRAAATLPAPSGNAIGFAPRFSF